MRSFVLGFCSAFFLSAPSFAVPVSSVPPAVADSAPAEDSGASARAGRWWLGFGGGVYLPTGALGSLYRVDGPAPELRLGFLVDPHWALRAGIDRTGYTLRGAAPGQKRVTVVRVAAATEYHFRPSKQWNAETGWDPYAAGGIDVDLRTKDFGPGRTLASDAVWGPGVASGTKYFFLPGRAALWFEGRAGLAFGDRPPAAFAANGPEGKPSFFYGANLGLEYFF